jgi:hypothetical protein
MRVKVKFGSVTYDGRFIEISRWPGVRVSLPVDRISGVVESGLIFKSVRFDVAGSTQSKNLYADRNTVRIKRRHRRDLFALLSAAGLSR